MAKKGPFLTANETCLNYIVRKMNFPPESSRIGATLPMPGDDVFQLNFIVFRLSGPGGSNDRERVNYPLAKNQGPWRKAGILNGQFDTQERAAEFIDQLERHFPAAADQNHLQPNVTTFQIMGEPEYDDAYVALVNEEEYVHLHYVRFLFDVIYNKNTK